MSLPNVVGTTNQLAALGQGLGYSQGGAPASVLGYKQANATPASADPNAAYIAEQNRLLAENKSLIASLNAQPKLLSFDYAGTQARAKQQAANSVNPIYIDKLNNYLAQARTNEQRRIEDTNKANALADENLKNALEASGVTRTRTTEDVATNIGQLNTAQEQAQADQGTNFDAARAALAGDVANAGLRGSGLGSQQVTTAIKNRNTSESRQTESFNQQKTAQELFKGRTFEDLANSDLISNRNNTLTKEGTKINLQRYLQDYGTDPNNYGTQIKAEIAQQGIDRENAIRSASGGYYTDLLNQYLATLKGARGQDIQLTKSVYGV